MDGSGGRIFLDDASRSAHMASVFMAACDLADVENSGLVVTPITAIGANTRFCHLLWGDNTVVK